MEEHITTTSLVREAVAASLVLSETLQQGLINYSALTRRLLPTIKKKNPKANAASVLIALQRYADELASKPVDNQAQAILANAEIIMKNNIASYTLERTALVMTELNEISRSIRWDAGEIFFFIQGTSEITVVIDANNNSRFIKLNAYIIEKITDLGIISLREAEHSAKKYSKNVPGYLALLTKTLADHHINILDIASTYRQIIFVIKEQQLTTAYGILSALCKYSGRHL